MLGFLVTLHRRPLPRLPGIEASRRRGFDNWLQVAILKTNERPTTNALLPLGLEPCIRS